MQFVLVNKQHAIRQFPDKNDFGDEAESLEITT